MRLCGSGGGALFPPAAAARHRFTFDVSQNVAEGTAALEIRIRVPRPIDVALRALTIEPPPETGEKIEAALSISDLLQLSDWLPFLKLGRNALIDRDSIV